MDIREKMEQAFKTIQASPVLYKAWNDCKTQQDRDVMMAQELWDLAFQAGYEEGYSDCEEDISMGG